MSDLHMTYISGPMTGYPEHNYPAFAAKAAELRANPLKHGGVISPAELHPADIPGVTWDWYLRRDLTELVKCSHIVMLPDWWYSKGASLEHDVAWNLGMSITYPNGMTLQNVD